MLRIENLEVSYGHARAVHGVSMGLERGEMVFLVGRNGAGKTTLLKALCGLLRPSAGTIGLEGRSIQGMPAEKLARLGLRFVAQDKKVFSRLTVRSNIALAAHAVGLDLDSAIAKVNRLYPKMNEFMDRRAGGLSGGQREILLIGRALVGGPQLLLIDEPTEGLAAVVIEDIFRILVEMKQRISTIIVEQNLSIVSRLADRIYVMKEGRIIKEISDKAEMADIHMLEQHL
jgi:ABC-type branched-subunit amino acid transport system ATPase component